MKKLMYVVNEQVGQLFHCQAWIYKGLMLDGINGNIIAEGYILKSYSTYVAFISNEGLMLEFGKWSRTTSCQVTRFYNEYKGGMRWLLDDLSDIELIEG